MKPADAIALAMKKEEAAMKQYTESLLTLFQFINCFFDYVFDRHNTNI